MSEEKKPDVERLDDNTLLWTPGVWANSVKPGQDLSLAALEAARTALPVRTEIVDNRHFNRITVTGGRGETVEYEPVDRWIRVEELMPTVEGEYLCWVPHRNDWERVFWEDGEWMAWRQCISHWQPLPPPPVDKSVPL